MQEDNVGAGLDGADMHIERAVVSGRKFRQLKVMRGKQRERLRFVVQVGGNAAYLHNKSQAFTLFATHYFELTEFPARHHGALNVHVLSLIHISEPTRQAEIS